MSGTLYVVGTPIGNLGDLTRRAEATLASVDLIAAEDTRRTRALLSHLGIAKKPLVSLDANASEREVAALAERLTAGETIAFVTDAGMPGVSDPAVALVRAAIAGGIPVTPVPGPSAVTAAVAVSGLVDGPFLFLGFLPRKGEKRSRLVRRMLFSQEPVVLFEAKNRFLDTLAELAESMPDREAVVLRELTKMHEEIVRGPLRVLKEHDFTELGEITIVVGASQALDDEAPFDVDAMIRERLAAGDSARSVAEAVAELSGKPRREIYQRVLEAARERAPSE